MPASRLLPGSVSALFTTLCIGLFPAVANAQTLDDEAVAWLQDLIRLDTVNPPGNEYRAVEYYSRLFAAEGIAFEIAESAPGRGNIWARLEGGDEPALILLQHTDVVPAEKEFWTIEPLSGDIRDGEILGRGAVDMKGLGALQLATFLSLHRSGVTLNRDVIFLATADEEAGGMYGVGWLIDNHPEIFEGVGFLLNEGGGGSRDGVARGVWRVNEFDFAFAGGGASGGVEAAGGGGLGAGE